MKYIKLFENYFSSEEVETESIDDLKMKLQDLVNKKLGGGPYTELVTKNENLFTIKHCSKKRWSYPGQIEPSIECEIKPYDSKGREGYPNYVIYLKTDKISKPRYALTSSNQGPHSFSEDRLHYVADIIFKFFIGLYDK